MVTLVAPQQPRYSTIVPPRSAVTRTAGFDQIAVVISGLTTESAFHLAATLQVHPAFAPLAAGILAEIAKSSDPHEHEEVAHAS